MDGITHGVRIEWLTPSGSAAFEINGCESRELAIKRAYEIAHEMGYRPPRWWEFRRRSRELNYEKLWRSEIDADGP